jgi:hypothetical protein
MPTEATTITIAAAAKTIPPVPVEAIRRAVTRKRQQLETNGGHPNTLGIPLPVGVDDNGLELFDGDGWDRYILGWVDHDGQPGTVPAVGYDLIAAWIDRSEHQIRRLWHIRQRHAAGEVCPVRPGRKAGAACCWPPPDTAAAGGLRPGDMPASIGRRGTPPADGPMFAPYPIRTWATVGPPPRLAADGETPIVTPPIGPPRRAGSQRTLTRNRLPAA